MSVYLTTKPTSNYRFEIIDILGNKSVPKIPKIETLTAEVFYKCFLVLFQINNML